MPKYNFTRWSTFLICSCKAAFFVCLSSHITTLFLQYCDFILVFFLLLFPSLALKLSRNKDQESESRIHQMSSQHSVDSHLQLRILLMSPTLLVSFVVFVHQLYHESCSEMDHQITFLLLNCFVLPSLVSF